MTRAELLAKIRKCLALAKSANEHEAANALAMARRLMDEYGVDEAEAATIDVGEADVRGGGASTPSRWETILAAAVTDAIPTIVISRGDAGWTFVGITPAPEIATYAFTTLYRQLKRARAAYLATALKRVRTQQMKTKRADAYCEGWVMAVRRKIAALYPEQATDALVLAYFERRFPDRNSLKPRAANLGGVKAANDRGRGWSAGHDVDLRHGVAGGGAPALIGHG